MPLYLGTVFLETTGPDLVLGLCWLGTEDHPLRYTQPTKLGPGFCRTGAFPLKLAEAISRAWLLAIVRNTAYIWLRKNTE